MNTKNIKSLAEIMQATGLTALKVKEGDLEIELKREIKTVIQDQPQVVAAVAQQAVPEAIAAPKAAKDSGLTEVHSPMVGVFYAAPSPEKPPYVKVGDKVSKGDVLCIIEAMKLMNEITAETDGEIAEICVSNGNVVEYSQVLFKIR